jgi:hypothetical protein
MTFSISKKPCRFFHSHPLSLGRAEKAKQKRKVVQLPLTEFEETGIMRSAQAFIDTMTATKGIHFEGRFFWYDVAAGVFLKDLIEEAEASEHSPPLPRVLLLAQQPFHPPVNLFPMFGLETHFLRGR